MVCGAKAFAASDVSSILRNVVEANPKLASEVNPEVPESLARLVAKLMAKLPEDRYETAGAALEDLQRIRSEMTLVEAEPELVGGNEFAGSSTMAHTPKPKAAADIDHSDRTPATATLSGTLRRPVRRLTFFGTILIVIIAVTSSVLLIRAATDDTPTYQYSDAQIAEFQRKRAELAKARILYSAGDYRNSIAAYEDYVTRYPYATVAREELAEAREAQRASEAAAAAAEAEKQTTQVAKRPKRVVPKTTPPKTEEKKPWYKRIFGGSGGRN
jgi:hypothetical protein